MKYVSVCCVSAGAIACMTPDRPPIVNMATSDTENIIGTVKWTLPAHMVAIQFKIFTPVGTAMNMVVAENAATETGPMPEVNIWCAHTPHPMKPMAAPDSTTIG